MVPRAREKGSNELISDIQNTSEVHHVPLYDSYFPPLESQAFCENPSTL